MTKSERFVKWVAGLVGVPIVIGADEDELAAMIETQFNNARMMTHSSMPNRETEAWWGGVTFACSAIYEKLGKEVPPDIAGMMAKFSRIFVG